MLKKCCDDTFDTLKEQASFAGYWNCYDLSAAKVARGLLWATTASDVSGLDEAILSR